MERWSHALRQKDKDFKELFGVPKEVLRDMHRILTIAYQERHRKGGRRAKLSVGDQLLLTL